MGIFDGAFGAYAYHETEMENIVSIFVDSYRAGYDINDLETIRTICEDNGLNLNDFSNSELQDMSERIERRINGE